MGVSFLYVALLVDGIVFFVANPKNGRMRAFLCDKKNLATNPMRGKIILRAKFCEHSKKCDHFFASNKIRCEQLYIFKENCVYQFFSLVIS